MAGNDSIVELLLRKKELFMEVESVTEEMCLASADDIPRKMERRSELLDDAQEADARIRELCGNDDTVRSALNNDCDRGGLTPELARLYDASLAVKAVTHRILQNESIAREHIEIERQNILDKIENMNKSSYVVADRYHRSVQTGIEHGYGLTRDKRI